MMASEMTEIDQLYAWEADGTLERLKALAGRSRDYRSGTSTNVPLVRVRRSAGHFSEGVLVGLNYGGLGCVVKFRYYKGMKPFVATSDLLEWNPLLDKGARSGIVWNSEGGKSPSQTP